MAAPQLIFTDTPGYNERIRQHGLYLDEMNMIVGDYNALGLPALSGVAEFVSLIQSPADLVFDKMTNGQAVAISNVPVNRADAMRIIAKPAGYDTLIAMVDAFKKHHVQWNNILLDKDIVGGAVVVSQATKDAELAACKIYAVTDDEQNLYAFLQDVITAAATRFGSKMANIPSVVSKGITPSLINGSATTGYSINANAVKVGTVTSFN